MCLMATSPRCAPRTRTSWPCALEGVPAIKQVKIYPLSLASAPPENEFINLAEICMNLVHANDFTFYEEVNELVQEEPAGALDAERAGQLAAIGIFALDRAWLLTGGVLCHVRISGFPGRRAGLGRSRRPGRPLGPGRAG